MEEQEELKMTLKLAEMDDLYKIHYNTQIIEKVRKHVILKETVVNRADPFTHERHDADTLNHVYYCDTCERNIGWKINTVVDHVLSEH